MKKRLLLLLIGVGMGFILYQGTRDLTTSLSISDQVVNRVLAYALNDPTLSSEAYFKYYPIANYLIRKLAHFTEYAVIGTLLAYYFRKTKSLKRDVLVYSLFGVILIALSDEYLQRFMGRGSLVSDVWIDFWGGLTGATILLLLSSFKNSFQSNSRSLRKTVDSKKQKTLH